MANHKSAKKRNRQTIKRTLVNKIKVSESRSLIKSLREAISSKNKDVARELVVKAQKYLARLAQAGIIKSNAAARKTSRLTSQVNSI